MTLTEKIKALFATEQKYADLKLKDGTIIRVEGELKEGNGVSVLAEDGSVSQAKEGNYEVEDGSKLYVDGEGKIKTIEPAPEVEAAAEEVDKPKENPDKPKEGEESLAGDAPVEDVAGADKITALEGQVAELQAALMQLAEQVKAISAEEPDAANEEVLAELKKENKNLKKEVKALAAEPAAPKVQFKKISEEIAKPNHNNSNSYFKDKKISSSFIKELRETVGEKK